jgi:tetratricopeptide (TPR) repeat protein
MTRKEKDSDANNPLSEKEEMLFAKFEQAIKEKEVIDFEAKLESTFGTNRRMNQYLLKVAAVFVAISTLAAVVYHFGYPSNKRLFGQYYKHFLAENTSGFSRGDYNTKLEALIYYAEGNYEVAIPAFLEVLKIQPEDYEVQFLLGISYIETGRCNEALSAFTVINNAPLNFYTDDALWYAALVEIKLNNYKSSKDLLLQIKQSSEYFLPAQKLLNKIKNK